MTSFFNLFWKLAEGSAAAGEACSELLAVLHEEEEQVSTQEDGEVAPNMKYSLTRLVRGLGSSRGSARQGFAAALTEVLLQFSSVTTDYIIELGDAEIAQDGRSNKKEKREYHFGRIFFVLVLTRSGRLQELQATKITAYIDHLVQLGNDKPLLREVCYNAVQTVAQQVSTHACTRHSPSPLSSAPTHAPLSSSSSLPLHSCPSVQLCDRDSRLSCMRR
jgi:DNA polymerase phi